MSAASAEAKESRPASRGNGVQSTYEVSSHGNGKEQQASKASIESSLVGLPQDLGHYINAIKPIVWICQLVEILQMHVQQRKLDTRQGELHRI